MIACQVCSDAGYVVDQGDTRDCPQCNNGKSDLLGMLVEALDDVNKSAVRTSTLGDEYVISGVTLANVGVALSEWKRLNK